MRDGADQKGDEHGDWLGEVGAGWVVDVAAEEVVDRDVPLAGEFEPAYLVSICKLRMSEEVKRHLPVTRVPPVGVEVTVCEMGDLRERTE